MTAKQGSSPLAVAQQLAAVAKVDTVYADLYRRHVLVGRERDWGRRQLWTRFDGHQLLRSGKLRALVGGDIRYGGLHDLVSLGYEEDKIIIRFAVVRRARMVARWL